MHKRTEMKRYRTIHIVCFQVPYPPVYGGLIDVYYKVKALHEQGIKVVLHTYLYGEADVQKALEDVTEKVFYYKRHTGITSLLSRLPYIVYSRRNRQLLENLLMDDAPILFEGLHTCYFLTHPALNGREKWVRLHNVEHDYYRGLATNTHSLWKKCFFRLEAFRLQQYEHVLQAANRLFPITPADTEYFSSRYSHPEVSYLPCFYKPFSSLENDVLSNGKRRFIIPYTLYHGNLSVPENVEAVCRILRLSHSEELSNEIRFVIAGHRPSSDLVKQIGKSTRVTLIANPSEAEMEELIRHAHINLLLTNQSTGIKLKLLHALSGGCGHVLVNTPMLPDASFREVCQVADTEEELTKALNRLYSTPLSPDECHRRIQWLQASGFRNDVSPLLRE